MTLNEYLEKFYIDGETVESVEMGGISPDYENAIQGLAFLIMTILKNTPPPADITQRNKIIKKALDAAVMAIGPKYGFSGAQTGAAGNLAGVFWTLGPSAALDKMRAEDMTRIIKVNKSGVIDILPGRPIINTPY